MICGFGREPDPQEKYVLLSTKNNIIRSSNDQCQGTFPPEMEEICLQTL